MDKNYEAWALAECIADYINDRLDALFLANCDILMRDVLPEDISRWAEEACDGWLRRRDE